MSIESMVIALHHSRAKGSARTLLIGIANHDGDGGAMPAMATLAKYAGVDVRQARKLVRRLEELGEIRTHVQAGTLDYLDDHEQPNRYDFLLACPAWCDRSSRHRDTRRYDARPLWTTPGPTGQGRSSRTGGPPVPQNPQTVPPNPANTGSASTTGHARPRDTTPPCQECAAPNLSTCAARQQHLRPEDRHHYVAPPARREDTP